MTRRNKTLVLAAAAVLLMAGLVAVNLQHVREPSAAEPVSLNAPAAVPAAAS